MSWGEISGAPQQPYLDTGGQGGGRAGNTGQRRVGYQAFGLSVIKDVGHLVPLVGGVHRHCDGPDQRQPKPGVDVLNAVGQEQADPVALLDTQNGEHGGRLQNAVIELLVRPTQSANLDKSLARVAADNFFQELAQ